MVGITLAANEDRDFHRVFAGPGLYLFDYALGLGSVAANSDVRVGSLHNIAEHCDVNRVFKSVFRWEDVVVPRTRALDLAVAHTNTQVRSASS